MQEVSLIETLMIDDWLLTPGYITGSDSDRMAVSTQLSIDIPKEVLRNS
jgi:hypothetical protein